MDNAIITALIGVGGVSLGATIPTLLSGLFKKGNETQTVLNGGFQILLERQAKMIDELQDQVRELKADIADMTAHIDRLSTALDRAGAQPIPRASRPREKTGP